MSVEEERVGRTSTAVEVVGKDTMAFGEAVVGEDPMAVGEDPSAIGEAVDGQGGGHRGGADARRGPNGDQGSDW
jgi:hypothetical protein